MTQGISVFMFVILAVGTWAGADTPAEKLIRKPDRWFQSSEAEKAMKCIISWQSDVGAWPKNRDTTREEFSGDRSKLRGTFDNGATIDELRALARAFRITGEIEYKRAFLKGYDHILEAQYSNGGWPQYFPLSKQYHRHITFNDGTMVRILELLKDTAVNADFKFLDQTRRDATNKAITRGIKCILKCQIIVDGKPTVWCAQHDEITLAPASARSYELASLSGAESAGILKFLMSIDHPDPEAILAVKHGIAWFESNKIEGFLYRKGSDEPCLIRDSTASPIWARFYEIKTLRPMFCDRDGIPKFDIQEIGSERRDGYSWYGNWGIEIVECYAKWPHREQ